MIPTDTLIFEFKHKKTTWGVYLNSTLPTLFTIKFNILYALQHIYCYLFKLFQADFSTRKSVFGNPDLLMPNSLL